VEIAVALARASGDRCFATAGFSVGTPWSEAKGVVEVPRTLQVFRALATAFPSVQAVPPDPNLGS